MSRALKQPQSVLEKINCQSSAGLKRVADRSTGATSQHKRERTTGAVENNWDRYCPKGRAIEIAAGFTQAGLQVRRIRMTGAILAQATISSSQQRRPQSTICDILPKFMHSPHVLSCRRRPAKGLISPIDFARR